MSIEKINYNLAIAKRRLKEGELEEAKILTKEAIEICEKLLDGNRQIKAENLLKEIILEEKKQVDMNAPQRRATYTKQFTPDTPPAFCPNCGQRVRLHDVKCRYCGIKLDMFL